MVGGLDITLDFDKMDFGYGKEVFGPKVEKRYLNDIRKTLMEPFCEGPEIVYSIAMDIGKEKDRADLISRNLLYGACIYASGRIGREPVRSQGHIHAVSLSCGSSTPEMYEIWEGEACIFMQHNAKPDVGTAYAVKCRAGDKVIVPPGYAHFTMNLNPDSYMAFGAWCVRDFGFDYEDVRKQSGLLYYPIIEKGGEVAFTHNQSYQAGKLIIKRPADYSMFGLGTEKTIYQEYEENHDLFRFVTNPNEFAELWEGFVP